MGYNRPHPLYCPQFLQDQHKIECPVEGGARIRVDVRLYRVSPYVCIVDCSSVGSDGIV